MSSDDEQPKSKKKEQKFAHNLPFIRITVLGNGGCGKTSLINQWVNNYCPTTYTETEWPDYYYKLVRLDGEGEDEQKESVVVEIEDTYSSSRGDGGRDVSHFLKLDRKSITPSRGEDTTPFAIYKEPPHHSVESPNQERDLSIGRMGFLIVYDVTDEDSWKQAEQLHNSLRQELANREAKRKERIEPEIFLVANKIDKDPHNKLTKEGENFCEEHEIFFSRVSALTNKKVSKTFETMVRRIKNRDALWQILEGQDDAASEDDEKEDGGGECIIQ
uniref:Uncharacterized protein n=1 Tax=Chromera velia CCMP2878 TaxID=1169474 RepID=A0A0G4GMQ2_9ALVE|mmetsp:Transcript_44207/g.87196  ORF Transcript_44207/g.87196 Transcript_44207/m.87196 type:complete len:274 (-) Transcript_44207:161-982(-)|eukprot:Cvel_22587.t1-p1 / transcript=Cvel_22587.t1 / gene=Cvel_22587 / organism=Chromera_velia_CCMP2878 / gene_product=Ras-related protein Rab-18-B, putative / transcript_product=Ras-related protein Rab-18-B, putative / location=Cvel_scaffold2233:30471-31289(-) / protein_length=273 / sequence_SO=supercontig / SO=protein_coding / is_pseudo=false